MLGMHGTKAAISRCRCDLLIAVGFDDRVTGKLNTFAPNASVIPYGYHDPAEMNKLRQARRVAGRFKFAVAGGPATAEDLTHGVGPVQAARRTRFGAMIDHLAKDYLCAVVVEAIVGTANPRTVW